MQLHPTYDRVSCDSTNNHEAQQHSGNHDSDPYVSYRDKQCIFDHCGHDDRSYCLSRQLHHSRHNNCSSLFNNSTLAVKRRP